MGKNANRDIFDSSNFFIAIGYSMRTHVAHYIALAQHNENMLPKNSVKDASEMPK